MTLSDAGLLISWPLLSFLLGAAGMLAALILLAIIWGKKKK